jgi:predicted nucleotidyltransferase
MMAREHTYHKGKRETVIRREASFCRRFGVLSLGLFGSATREDFRAGTSDLDFVVEFAPMAPHDHAAPTLAF